MSEVEKVVCFILLIEMKQRKKVTFVCVLNIFFHNLEEHIKLVIDDLQVK